jgi:hypothetical protein
VCEKHLANSAPVGTGLHHRLDPTIEGIILRAQGRKPRERIDEMWPPGPRIAHQDSKSVTAPIPGQKLLRRRAALHPVETKGVDQVEPPGGQTPADFGDDRYCTIALHEEVT